MEYFLQLFGDKSIGWAVSFLCMIVFLIGCYKKAEKYFTDKAIREEIKDKQIKEVIQQAKLYPQWHQQSIEIRSEMDKKMNRLDEKLDYVSDSITEMKKDTGKTKATSCRYRILRFDDEIRHDELHTKEHFNQILEDITEYERYCKSHKEYINNKATLAIENIKNVYRKCNENSSFL